MPYMALTVLNRLTSNVSDVSMLRAGNSHVDAIYQSSWYLIPPHLHEVFFLAVSFARFKMLQSVYLHCHNIIIITLEIF